VKFRAVSYEDIPDIVQLSEKTASAPWSADSYSSFIGRADTDFEIFQRRASSRSVEGFYLSATVEGEAELLVLVVRAKLWGQGIGRRLMERWLQRARARNCTKCHLEVASQNERAIRLYQRNGFLEVGVRKGYYGSAIGDALVMSLGLRDKRY
jgi:ribosomal-protein-alanine N-acetyltransferase